MHIKRVPLRGRRATGVQDWRQKDRNLAAIHAPNVFGDQADKHVKSRPAELSKLKLLSLPSFKELHEQRIELKRMRDLQGSDAGSTQKAHTQGQASKIEIADAGFGDGIGIATPSFSQVQKHPVSQPQGQQSQHTGKMPGPSGGPKRPQPLLETPISKAPRSRAGGTTSKSPAAPASSIAAAKSAPPACGLSVAASPAKGKGLDDDFEGDVEKHAAESRKASDIVMKISPEQVWSGEASKLGRTLRWFLLSSTPRICLRHARVAKVCLDHSFWGPASVALVINVVVLL